MGKVDEASNLMRGIQRNYPDFPSTVGPCSKGCGAMARGSGMCADCLAFELSELIGVTRATEFHDAIKHRSAVVHDIFTALRERE